MKPTTTRQPLALRIGSRRVLLGVASIADASRLFLKMQRAAMERGGMIRRGEIFDGTSLVARVSQNGRVWPAVEWQPGIASLYDPTDADFGLAPQAEVLS